MKILIINKFYYLKGGCERYFFGLAKLLEEKGHQVIPFSMADDKNYSTEYGKYFIEKVNLTRFSIKNIIKFFYNYEAVKKLEDLIRREKPDIAHLHNIAHQLSPAIINVLKKNNIPLIQTLHDYKLICPNYKLFSNGRLCQKCLKEKYYWCFLKKCVDNSRARSLLSMLEVYFNNKILKIYRKVDLFIAPSQFMKDICVKFGVPKEKIKVIHNLLTSAKPGEQGLFKKENLNAQNYILYFGRLSKEKGVSDLIEAYSQIKTNCQLKIVGTGPERKKLEKIVLNNKLQDKVEFTGVKYGAELHQLIYQSEFVVVPSIWYENAPYCVVEAMALGKAVVAAKIGGLEEIINHGVNGLLYEKGDIAGLRSNILCLLDHPEIVDKYGKNALIGLKKKFDRENHYNELIKIYQSLDNLARIR